MKAIDPKTKLLRAPRATTVLEVFGPILSVIFAMLVASIALVMIGKNPFAVYGTMFSYSFGRIDSVAYILTKATPLIFAGIAVAISFKVNLFNIGVEGQYAIGAFCASWAGSAIHGLPMYIHLPIVILAGACGGALWSLIPIWLKLKRGVHEVITTIMLNSTAYMFLHYLMSGPFKDKAMIGLGTVGSASGVRMAPVLDTARIPPLHGLFGLFGIEIPKYVSLNWFLILGLVLAVGMYLLLWKTPFGMEVRAVGHNPKASEAAGIKSHAVMFRAFVLSGAVAGLVGLADLLGYFGYLDIDFPKGYGFTGIAVALVGKNGALGIVLASLLFGFLSRGGMGIQVLEKVPMETYYILQGLIILCIVIGAEIVKRVARAQQKREEAQADA